MINRGSLSPTQQKVIIALVAVFLWIGFLGAISFMEAWLKFRAPGVTVALGLGIGKLVFYALNKMEWIFAAAIMLNILLYKNKVVNRNMLFLIIPVILLIVQTAWMLPALDARADAHIAGNIPAASNLHLYYIGAEVLKLICLLFFGITLFERNYGTGTNHSTDH